MLVVHRLVWVNVTTHVVGTNDIGVTHLLRRLDCGRRRWPETDSRLWTRSTRCKEHERNEREVFHGWRVTVGCAADGTVGGTAVNAGNPWLAAELVSSSNAFEAPMTASARSTVWSTYR